jgi:hypothetical protein
MNEGQYTPAIKVWRETAFEELPDRASEYYRLGMLVLDELAGKRDAEGPGKGGIGERAREVIRMDRMAREERARGLERLVEDLKQKLNEQAMEIEVAQ